MYIYTAAVYFTPGLSHSASLCFLKDLAQRLACLICRLAPREDADIVDVACGHGVWRLIAFIYQVGVVEEVEDR